MDLVITVCDNAAGEVCPFWPDQPATEHWGSPDPSNVVGSDAKRLVIQIDFAAVRDVGKRPQGLVLTVVINGLIKPFAMAATSTG